MRKKWYINKISNTGENLESDPILQGILKKRGLTEEKDLCEFLYGTLDDLHDPFILQGMTNAVERIMTAINKDERIIIFGDYDVDGITSTTLLYEYFKKRLSTIVDYYLPDRQKEGYGLNSSAIQEFINQGYQLVITVDCGISAHQEVNFAQENGLDIIITDHHQPGDTLPEAVAVIDPHQIEGHYPFKYLAGVGVAFKLCQALEKKIHKQEISPFLEQLLDLVTLGTVADIAPLLGENRIMIKEGLKLMKNSKNLGLKTLISEVGLGAKDITPGHIGYIIAPHLNAAGRLSNPVLGIKLLTTDNADEALTITSKLKETNNERRSIEGRILNEAVEMVEKELNLEEEKAIILASEDWHHGVVGIVASRLVERYYRPVILIVLEDGIGRGSCRSIGSLNIYQALKECSEYLDGFGGHEMAAGLTIKTEQLNYFKKAFNKYLSSTLSSKDYTPEMELDGILSLTDINLDLYKRLEILEPYGVGNPRPRFILNDVQVANSYSVGKDKNHLKIKLKSGLEGICFGSGEQSSNLAGERVNLAFFLDLNEWNGKKKVQLKLEDFILRNEVEHYPVFFKMDDLTIADKRGCKNKKDYLKLLQKPNHKILVYTNERDIVESIKVKFRNNAYYGHKKEDIKSFRNAGKGIIVFTNQMIANRLAIDELVFFSLPFSLQEMAGIIDSCIEHKPVIHFLFGQDELEKNKKIIHSRLPGEGYLRRFYLFLQSMPENEFVLKEFKKVIGQQNNLIFNSQIMEKSLSILEELNLIKKSGNLIRRLPVPREKLDLSHSISYNDTINIINNFNKFAELVFANDLFVFINYLKKVLEEES